jgi:octanoyl-[GcvH]:protein N-octanoyltransferase
MTHANGVIVVPVVPLYRESPADAALDVAVSHALLRDGREALRLWTPPPALSFGRLDLLSPGRDRAIVAARSAGLAPVRRLAGGRAAPIGPNTVCLGWASPSHRATDMQRRYELLAEVLLDALAALGVPSRVGELTGEWCPGSWSIIAGATKVAGLAQRVIRTGAWAEAVVIVHVPEQARQTLDAVQRALGVEWAPDTLGGLADEHPGLTGGQVLGAVLQSLRKHWALEDGTLTPGQWQQAASLRSEHAL